MSNFIKAKFEESGEEVYINLNLVSTIVENEEGYLVNLLGNKYIVDKKYIEIKDEKKEIKRIGLEFI